MSTLNLVVQTTKTSPSYPTGNPIIVETTVDVNVGISVDPTTQAVTLTMQSNNALNVPLDSPAFTGTPTGPTPPDGDNLNAVVASAFIANILYNAPPLQNINVLTADNQIVTDTAGRPAVLAYQANSPGTYVTTADGQWATDAYGNLVSLENGI